MAILNGDSHRRRARRADGVTVHFAYQVAVSGVFGALGGITVTKWRPQKISGNLA